MSENVIYKATTKAETNNWPTETYVRLTETTFKQRFANHLITFKHPVRETLLNSANMFGDLKILTPDIPSTGVY